MVPLSPPRSRRLGRTLIPLGLIFLSVGVSAAFVLPFLSLFLSTAVHAGPLRVTVFLVCAPLAGVVAATLIGRLSDRYPIRRRLLIGAALAGVLGTGVTAVVRDYWILFALAVTATAIAGTLYPQSFAYARQLLIRDGAERAALGISALRTVFSLAWVAGPPLAAVLVEVGGFTAVYGAAAVLYAIAAAVAAFGLTEVPRPEPAAADREPAGPNPGTGRWTLWLTAAAFTMLCCPMTLNVQALSLFLTTDLGGDVGDAGLILGLCALLEIPLMLGLGLLTTRIRLRTLLLAGAACGVVYEVLASLSSGVGMLAVAQPLNAFCIAAVTGLGITYMQDLLPREPGRATTLFTNTFPIGAVLAGPLFGLSQQFGYRLAYVFSAVLCAAGLLLLVLIRPGQPKLTPSPEQPAWPPAARPGG